MGEFYNNQEDLVFLSEEILANRQKTSIKEKYKDILKDIDIEGETIMREVKVRVNQSVFRTMVLNNYYLKCCITGLNIPELIIASHIVPWSKNEKERLNPRNGLCLNAFHDRAFDSGLITISPDYRVILSTDIRDLTKNDTVYNYFSIYENKKINIPEKFAPSQEFLV